jgi:hypothetical protein
MCMHVRHVCMRTYSHVLACVDALMSMHAFMCIQACINMEEFLHENLYIDARNSIWHVHLKGYLQGSGPENAGCLASDPTCSKP